MSALDSYCTVKVKELRNYFPITLTDFLYIVGMSKYSFEVSVTTTKGGAVTFLRVFSAINAKIARIVIDMTVIVSRAVYLSIN